MAIENSNKEDLFSKNYSFLSKWHNDNYTVFKKGEKFKDTSMQLGTYGIDNKTFILPTYKKGVGKIADPAKYFLEDIKSGKIQGYNSKDAAEEELKSLRSKILQVQKNNGNRK